MAFVGGRTRLNIQLKNILKTFLQQARAVNSATMTATQTEEIPEQSKISDESFTPDRTYPTLDKPFDPDKYRQVYPEFLPDPNPFFRNPVRERLERKDLISRRANCEIPEFYVGSILAVTHSDKHAPGKINRFLGICIDRKGCGLRAAFTLRNVIDKLGIEITYDLYDPTIQKIECIRLEKRLDDQLFYLRDAPQEYSYFPQDMEAEYLPEGSPVPLNELKVPLKPPPRAVKWEIYHNIRGIADRFSEVTEKRKRRSLIPDNHKPWEQFNLMKLYRDTIPVEEQREIFSEIHTELHNLEMQRRKMKRSRTFVRPKKEG